MSDYDKGWYLEHNFSVKANNISNVIINFSDVILQNLRSKY